ncbi:unnamed protein product, partial [marine sediment metagenome]
EIKRKRWPIGNVLNNLKMEFTMSKNVKYSDHLETIVALVTHLAMTRHKSRTPTILSSDLSLDHSEVSLVLNSFKGLFRESIKTTKQKDSGYVEHYYWLQLRYARWWLEEQQMFDEDNQAPLEPEYIGMLLSFISAMVEQEKAEERQTKVNYFSLTASICALVASIIAAIISSGLFLKMIQISP